MTKEKVRGRDTLFYSSFVIRIFVICNTELIQNTTRGRTLQTDPSSMSCLILLRLELRKFFLGVSDVGFLSDPELKKLLLAA